MRLENIEQLESLREKVSKALMEPRTRIYICMTGCRALGADEVCKALCAEIEKRNLTGSVEVIETGCQGLCAYAPVMTIQPFGIFYGRVTPADAPEIISKTAINGKPIERLCYQHNGRPVPLKKDIPFFKAQKRIVLRNCGAIDPRNIHHYIARGGYESIARVLAGMSPEDVIEEVKKSGLRGRGGAGFPTGLKWQFAREAKGTPKYLVCNADEGDPGAFMDRAVLEGDPHSVLEGMLIAAFAIGASRGFIYVRAEYPIAVEHIGVALRQARELGLLGENILGLGFSFDIEIRQGAGAFVCGEETALIASIEGKRGCPRPRPPFPAQSGLWGKPTNINNVETLANIPIIIKNGADWYARTGTEQSKGTKIFALAGKVNNTGLVEVPIGTTIRQVVFDIGGGIARGRKFKAVQMGGPSGGCVPARYLDMPIDYETLKEVGAIMGSGGLIVLDEGTCMVDIARYFLQFTQNESCGKCPPCRIGTRRMLDILEKITEGRGQLSDIDELEELGNGIIEGSLCALGKTAPKPVLSTIRHFREEYEEHILHRHCRAAVCEALVPSPCQHRCPAHINVPQYVSLIALKKFDRALDLIRRRNPFASTCGRVCNHPCEILCRRGEMDEPIAIMDLKRAAADYSKRKRWNLSAIKAPKTGKKVAVIGAGPAGLTAAYFLALMGHSVTVFEKHERPGGMLVQGIPEFRLPRAAVEQDINYIKSAGVKIKTSSPIADEKSFRSICKKFNAVFVAIGTQRGLKMGIEGEDSTGVMDGLTYLKQFHAGERMELGKNVIVVGGGNVAIDAARVALRSGAEKVTILYRRSREEMPALHEEIEQAEQEGIELKLLLTPSRIIAADGRVSQVECVRMRLGEADESGRRRPIPIEGSEFTMPADSVIIAIGQAAETEFLERFTDGKIQAARGGLLKTDPVTLQTTMEGVFAGGDCVHGSATVVEAVGAGQRAAVQIDKFLGGEGDLPPNSDSLVADLPSLAERAPSNERAKIPLAPPDRRKNNFSEVRMALDKESARVEAMRCLRCDLER